MCNEKSSLSTPLRLADAEEDLVVPAYFTAYRSLRLTRDALGVLVVEFHSKSGAFIMSAQAHTEFVDAFYRISQDRANKIVILTGAGGEFIVENAVGVGFDFPFHGSMPRMVWRPRGSLSQGGARRLHSNQHNCCHQKRTQFL
jgi:hypothetical protein